MKFTYQVNVDMGFDHQGTVVPCGSEFTTEVVYKTAVEQGRLIVTKNEVDEDEPIKRAKKEK